MSEHRVRHWSETLAKEVIFAQKEPFVVASGITTSGTAHMGTVCEFLYPSALVKYLLDEGKKVDFIFIGDIMDAFDSIPKSLEKFTFLKQHLGKPLCTVPDPYDCCESFGDHFLNALVKLMSDLEVPAKILRSSDLIQEGQYDSFAVLYQRNRGKVVEIAKRVAELSGVQGLPEWVDILMPVCKNCGKISTTRILNFDGDFIEYACDKDVKYTQGCGHKGQMRLKEHKYKLFWRLDWPSRQAFLNVSAELAGMDHHTRGGSWETCVMVHRELLNREPPVGHRFGFVLLQGRKYSKSRGIGLSVQELLSLVPPPLIKYKLFKPDLEENKDFDPSGNKLLSLYAEYNHEADLHEKGGPLQRADEKTILAYKLSTSKRRWRVDFADLVVAFQIYEDWSKAALRLGDPEGVQYLQKYAENWVKQQYLPEEYVFKLGGKKVEDLQETIVDFTNRLVDSMKAQEVHDLVYSVANDHGIATTKLFEGLYQSLISKSHGPRFGRLVQTLGIGNAKEMLLRLYK
ncbi:lysine--tRNA ligase [Candidatus Bathyarchaeota archaeon]|nr:lysine--tRNA ligase [Candidatus Bathyarchaeota archaeon]